MRVLANDELLFPSLTFDLVELVPSCRNLVYGPETMTESALDFLFELVPFLRAALQALACWPAESSPLSLPTPSRPQRPFLRRPQAWFKKAPSSIRFTGRAVFVISPASSRRAHVTQHPLLRTGKVQRMVPENYRVC